MPFEKNEKTCNSVVFTLRAKTTLLQIVLFIFLIAAFSPVNDADFPNQAGNEPSVEITVLDSKVSPVDGKILVYVPEGDFIMGSDTGGSINNDPEHVVFLHAFWIDQTEVSNGQYLECVNRGACSPPGNQQAYGLNNHYDEIVYKDNPVEFVNWFQATDYCKWAGRRLPTEAEWEKAARGTEGWPYPWGNDPPNWDLLNYKGSYGQVNPLGGTNKVGSYPAGASPNGALDMAGNVNEWVADWYEQNYYDRSPFDNPQGPLSGTTKVIRGGDWSTYDVAIYSAYRSSINPDLMLSGIGFRCAVSASQ